MMLPNKILISSLLLSYLSIGSFTLYAQNNIKHTGRKSTHKTTTFGVVSSREMLFNSKALLPGKQNKIRYGTGKSLVIRKPLNTHFKAEASFGYGTVCGTPFGNPGFPLSKTNTSIQGKLSMPVTVQYYFLPEKSRIHPYCGAGLQGNILTNSSQPNFTDDRAIQISNTRPDTKYITILFTQGVTFEVNTKIEVSQSFHFIPGSTGKAIGIDLGIGYKIP